MEYPGLSRTSLVSVRTFTEPPAPVCHSRVAKAILPSHCVTHSGASEALQFGRAASDLRTPPLAQLPLGVVLIAILHQGAQLQTFQVFSRLKTNPSGPGGDDTEARRTFCCQNRQGRRLSRVQRSGERRGVNPSLRQPADWRHH